MLASILIFRISGAQDRFVPVANHSMVSFSIENLGITVKGKFTDFSGLFVFDEHHPEKSHFESAVKTQSLETGIALRDKHLKNDNYFNVDKFPEMKFTSERVSKIGDNTYRLVGALIIKGRQQQISFPIKAVRAKNGYHFECEFPIDRRDFRVGGNSLTMGDVVTVKLDFQCELK